MRFSTIRIVPIRFIFIGSSSKNRTFVPFLYHNEFMPAEQSPKNGKTALGTIYGTKSRKLAFFAPKKSYTRYSGTKAR